MQGEGERDELVMELVSATLEQSPETRESYLRSACAGDVDLFAEVSERVEWEQRMGGFLGQTVVEVLDLLDRPFEAGELVAGRFRVLKEVGRGGMGVVYEAHDEKLDRRVALKTAVGGHDNRLPPETRAAREVSHFNVCKVHELHSARTELGEVEFLTMEFIPGETLSARIQRTGPLAPAEARDIAGQISAGLAQAHRQGVIHRDLKCSNVILNETPDGGTRAVITDFGLASFNLAEGETGARSPLRGSFDYMAPELFSGGQPGIASDLYALGVIFHEMLTGKVPAPAEKPSRPEDASTRTLTPVTRLRRHRPEKLPKPWGKIVARCLEADPEDRFASTDELIRLLEARPGKRRWLAAIPAAAAIVAVALWLGREKPGPPVRLAVLPIVVEGAPVPAADGLGVELAERLSGARRGFVVIPPAEAQRNSVNTVERAKTAMAATHVLRTRVRNSGGRLAVEASVIATNSNLTLQELRGAYSLNDLALAAKALTATITSAFRLPARVPMEVLARAAYPSYVQGLNLLRRDAASADEAMPFFRKAIEQDPRSALPYAGLAEAYLQKFQQRFGTEWMDRATRAVMRAQSLNTDSAPVLLAAGLLKYLHGWYEQAAQDYSRAAELAPGSADAWNRLALAYSAMNRPDQAITTYRKALEAQPDYYLPYIDFGRFYRKQLQFPEAEQLFRHVTVIAPDLAVGHTVLGLVLQQQNRLSEAEQAFLTSLRLQETGLALIDLGALYYQEEFYDKAVQYFTRSLALDGPNALRYANLADAYRHSSRTEEATKSYRMAEALARSDVERNPSDPSKRSLHAFILAHLKVDDLAKYEINQALVMGAGSAAVTRDAVLVYESLGEREMTMKVLADAPLPLIEELSRQPDVRSLQQDTRFQELLRSKAAQP